MRCPEKLIQIYVRNLQKRQKKKEIEIVNQTITPECQPPALLHFNNPFIMDTNFQNVMGQQQLYRNQIFNQFFRGPTMMYPLQNFFFNFNESSFYDFNV